MRKSRATPPATSATETPTDASFLSRWARRKRIARDGGDPDGAEQAGAEVRDRVPAQASVQAPEQAPEQASSDAPVRELTDADMPAMDSIDENTDMSGFFTRGVSNALKRTALRKFFHSSAFNVVDGLDDYAEDFTSFAPLGDVVTADMRHRMEVEAERARAAAEAEAEGVSPAQPGAPAQAQVDAGEGGSAEEALRNERASESGSDEPAALPQAGADGIARDGTADTVSGKLRRRDARDEESS